MDISIHIPFRHSVNTSGTAGHVHTIIFIIIIILKGMGKAGKKKSAVKYEHNHTHNPKAHESDERKLHRLNTLEIKRLKGYVDKQIEHMTSYIPEHLKKPQAKGIDSFLKIVYVGLSTYFGIRS